MSMKLPIQSNAATAETIQNIFSAFSFESKRAFKIKSKLSANAYFEINEKSMGERKLHVVNVVRDI